MCRLTLTDEVWDGLKTELCRWREVGIAGVVTIQRGVPVQQDEWARLEAILESAINALPPDTKLVLFLDEVPWWLDGLKENAANEKLGQRAIREALARLRYLRQREGLRDKLRMGLTGSLGLAAVAQQAGAAAELNDLSDYQLKPLAPLDGAGLFEFELTVRGLTCTPPAAKHAHRLAGGIPHWLKLLAASIRMKVDAPVAEREVDLALDALLAPRVRRAFEDEGNAHLRRRYGSNINAAKAILTAAAQEEAGATLATLFTVALKNDISTRDKARALVLQLVDEFYLDIAGEHARFANPIFRQWWLRYGQPA